MGEERKLTIWNAVSGVREAEGATGGDVTDVDWQASGSTIAVVAGKDIEIWNTQPLAKQKVITGARADLEWPMSVRWSPDGKYLAIGTNHPAVYIAKAGSQSASLQPLPKGSVYLLDWSGDGTRLAAAGFGSDSTIVVWKNVTTAVDSPFEKKYELSATFVPPAGQWWSKVAWDPTGNILAFGDSTTTFSFFDPSTGATLKTFVPHPKSVPIEAHWHGNHLITVGAYPDKDFKVW